MTKKEQKILLDLAGFIAFAYEHPKKVSFNKALATLAHDIRGLVNEEPCFSPRSSGYAEVIAKLSRKA